MSKLLVIDDEESVRYSFRRVFESEGVQVLTAGTAAEGLEQVSEQRPDVVVLDLQLPDRSGLEVFQEIKALDPRRPVIFITAHGTTETAIEAMKGGAFDYLVKPVDLDRLRQLVERAFEAARLMHVPAMLPAEEVGDRIVGHSPVMQEMSKAIGRIAPQDVNVLILGESGTGKELVARALYQHSRRADRPFLVINCAAIPETLLESELFGHEQGAFTGAARRRIGKFEQCDGGTLFLDEIGDMAPGLQAKILRVLQEQSFERLGSNETLQTRVRVLAATNRNLDKLVAEGRFRQDLYYRLKVVTIQLPPLRDRLDDVAELAHYFLFRFDRELALDLRGFAPQALEILQQHDWPGNVRELQSEIKQAMLNASGHIILPKFLSATLRPSEGPACRAELESVAPSTAPTSATLAVTTDTALPGDSPTINLDHLIDTLLKKGEKDLHAKVVEAAERILFARVLRHTHGHQAQASELLGLNRSTLRIKLRAVGLAVDKVVTGEARAEEEEK
jgi:two-component system nitrogen regulation response regulator GlnG